MKIHQYIEAHLISRPDAIAVRFKQSQSTYGELHAHSNQLACYLNSLGVSDEDRVVVCLEPSLEIAVSLLAIFKIGGVYVPLDPSYPSERLANILEEIQPKIVITQSHLLSDLPITSEHVFCIDKDWQNVQDLPIQNLEHAISPQQTAYIVYTSGTTGKPKGVMVSHSNLLHYIQVAQAKYGFNEQDIMPAIARFTFSISFFELLSPLVAGGTLLILERDQILDFKRMALILEQITAIHAGPSLLRALLNYIEQEQIAPQQFQNLKHVSTGGDIVPVDILERMKKAFQDADIFVIYGCSESSCMGCTYQVPRHGNITKSLVGQAFNNVSIRLYDESHNIVPIGITGEIYIGGAGIAKEYLYREELTQTKFITIDGIRFYRTGDIGRFDESGNLEVLGRSDFQIKLRGIRIELNEIETFLRQAPNVKDAVVSSCDLDSGEKVLVAYVVLEHQGNQVISTAEIRRFLMSKLPDYMVPNMFMQLEALPLNINQKIDRKALPPFDFSQSINAEFVAPRDQVEQQLANIWAKLLARKSVGIHDNFFDLGGHSLLSMRLISEIEQAFDYQFPLKLFFQISTIAEMAEAIRLRTSDNSDIDDLALELGMEDYRAILCQSAGKTGLRLGKHGLIINILPESQISSQPFVWIGEGKTAQRLKLKQPIYVMPGASLSPSMNSHQDYVSVISSLLVDELLSAQPSGSYSLGGWCYNGYVAMEMAQQLQKMGKKVELVTLIDVEGNSKLYKRLHLLNHYFGTLKFHLFNISKLSLRQKWQYIVDRIKPKNTSTKPPKGTQDVEVSTEFGQDSLDLLFKAGTAYKPKPYTANVLLIGGSEKIVHGNREVKYLNLSWFLPHNGWEGLLQGEVYVNDVPCDHLDLMEEPYCQKVGDIIHQISSLPS